MSTKQRFDEASERYHTYITTHDVGAMRASAEQAIAAAKAPTHDRGALDRVRDAARQIDEFARELEGYAEAGERFFAALRAYDDDLMAWTRSLGARSERLRKDTFPFVEHIKRYPPPTGLTSDPPEVKAADLARQVASLEAHMTVLDSTPYPRTSGTGQGDTLDQIGGDIEAIWSSGRSVEYVAGLHDEYFSDLRKYDSRVAEEAAAAGDSGQSPGRRLLATGLDLLLGATVFGGLFALFMPRGHYDPVAHHQK